jgi:hypothetical protein
MPPLVCIKKLSPSPHVVGTTLQAGIFSNACASALAQSSVGTKAKSAERVNERHFKRDLRWLAHDTVKIPIKCPRGPKMSEKCG